MTDRGNSDASLPTKVGYCRPPKSGQFKPGKSGNPKGRPKGTKGLATTIRERAGQKIEVQINGRTVTMTMAEAIITRVLRDAVSGKRGAIDQSFRLLERHLPVEDDAPKVNYDFDKLTLSEKHTLLRLFAKAEDGDDAYWTAHEDKLRESYQTFLEEQRAGLCRGETFEDWCHRTEQHRREEQQALDAADDLIREAILARVVAGPVPVLPPAPSASKRSIDDELDGDWPDDEEN